MSEIRVAGHGEITQGRRCSIGENVKVVFIRPGKVALGDYVTIGEGVKLLIDGGNVSLGDWTTVHNDSTILSTAGVDIGEHCWFGQHTILDGTGGLRIERGTRVGMYSQLWSHVGAGEQIEGCTLFGKSPIHIEEDVWLVGSVMVAPGVRVGRRTIALAGSNITKDAPAEVVLAGSPAKVKEGLSFYRPITLDEKFELLIGWISELAHGLTLDAPSWTREGDVLTVHWDGQQKVQFHKYAETYKAVKRAETVTPCCVETKQYEKRFTEGERAVLKFLSGNKARFFAS